MSDTILVRYLASHSAKGVQLSAKQVGLIPDNKVTPLSDEETGDIA